MTTSKLIDHLVSVGNKSGAIRCAPQGLRDMKEALERVPFDVVVPGMSNLIKVENMVAGIVDMVGSLGSLRALGDLGPLMSRVGAELGTTDVTKIDPARLTEAVSRVASSGELSSILGGATSLLTSLQSLKGDRGDGQAPGPSWGAGR